MVVATLAFAVSNGYLSTALLLQGTQQDLQAAEQEVASAALIFSLALGLAVGSLVSCAWLLVA